MRQLPQSKARYLSEMLEATANLMDQIYPDDPDEATERHLARIIDRIASNADVPSTLFALELQRLRAQRKA